MTSPSSIESLKSSETVSSFKKAPFPLPSFRFVSGKEGWASRMLMLSMALFLLGVDWASKSWVRASFDLGETRVLWPGVLDATYVHNTGAAWSLFNAYPQYLLLLAAVFSFGLLVLILVVPFRRPLEWTILSLLLGGALGNLLDRVLLGAVTDFIDVPFIPDYPIFNVADSFIFCAVALMLLGYMKGVWPRA